MHYVKVKTLLSTNNGFNIFRGCHHGCIYCDARSTCYQMKHKFEDIEIKENAIELLEKRLKSKRKKCMIATGSMCDPYDPIEKNINYTRRCLELIDKYGYGLYIQTKSNLILRDLDILKSINKKTKCVVAMTLTTYDEELCKKIEPNVCTTKERFKVLKILEQNNIPTVVWISPILPYINDTKENLMGILDYCIKANVYGIICFGFGVTLRDGDREYFYEQLDKKFPGLKQKYIQKYRNSYEVNSDNNEKLYSILEKVCKENNIVLNNEKLFKYFHEFPEEVYKDNQISLFEE